LTAVSPWFSTHFGREVSWSKNWVFPSDLLWFNRWQNLLTAQPAFIEILSWNDYGESHYVGPLSSKHTDDGSSKWVNDMPHGGWLDMAQPFIAAYKDGATSVQNYVVKDQLVYWYRPTPKSLNCDATDNTAGGRPEGWEQLSDSVFVVALLTSAGTVTVQSGANTVSFAASAGPNAFQVPMGVGAQKFTVSRRTTTVLSGRSQRDVSDVCPCGLYNFNAYVGTLPEGGSDPVGPDGLTSLTNGLKVTTCQAKPSLGNAYNTAITSPMGTSTSSSASTSTPVTSTSISTSKPPTSTSTSKPATSTSASTSKPATSTRPASTSKPATSTSTPSSSKPATSTKAATTTPQTTMKTTTTSIKSSTSTTAKPTTTSVSSGGSGSGSYCVAGTNAPGASGNLIGLCQYACSHNYCPPGPCVCTKYSSTPPRDDPSLGVGGCVQPGLDGSYIGLCSFSCNRGYCPSGACYKC
jgi:hypothetical protein